MNRFSLTKLSFLSDCVLVSSDGVEHEVHRPILALHSSVLLQMFEMCGSENFKDKKRVTLEDLDDELLNAIVGVMYTVPKTTSSSYGGHSGHGISLDNVKQLAEAARKYDMPAVTAACDDFLEKEAPGILTFSNTNTIATTISTLHWYSFAFEYGLQKFLWRCDIFFSASSNKKYIETGIRRMSEIELCNLSSNVVARVLLSMVSNTV